MPSTPLYKRILLKISGEMLAGDQDFGLNPTVLGSLAEELIEVRDLGVQLGLVIGGGNIFRGIAGSEKGMERAHADYMGMLATVINALAMQDALERRGCYTRVMSALRIESVCEPYIRRRAARHLEKGRVVIFAAGTGSPFFSTDTTAALRASEMGADVILKATQVDGVYTADPRRDPTATRYETVTFQECLAKRLNVMDATAFSLCMDNHIPIIIFDLGPIGNLSHALRGQPIGTLVHGEDARK